MWTRPVQDKHDDRSPRLVKHSGGTAAESGVDWGTKSVGYLEWRSAGISRLFCPFLSSIFSLSRELSNARLMLILFRHDKTCRWLWTLAMLAYNERGVFAVGNCQAHAFNKSRAFEKVHVSTGRIGSRSKVQTSSVV